MRIDVQRIVVAACANADDIDCTSPAHGIG
jgi:hypothetical protein